MMMVYHVFFNLNTTYFLKHTPIVYINFTIDDSLTYTSL